MLLVDVLQINCVYDQIPVIVNLVIQIIHLVMFLPVFKIVQMVVFALLRIHVHVHQDGLMEIVPLQFVLKHARMEVTVQPRIHVLVL